MTGKSEKAKKRTPKVWLFFAFLVISLGTVPLLGVAVRPVLESVLIVKDPEEQWSPLLLEQEGESVLLACSDRDSSLLVRMNSAGTVLASRETDDPPRWAGLRNGTLYLLRTDDGGSCTLVSCDAETLEETGRRELDLPSRELLFFDMNSRGTVAAVLSGSRDTLLLLSPDGTRRSFRLEEEITFLSAKDGVILVSAGNTLTLLDGEESRELPSLAPVIAALSSELVLDEDGVVARVEEDGLVPLFHCEQPLYSSLSFCLDGENCLILSGSDSQVVRYEQDGTVRGACQLESTPLAVCRSGGVIRKDGGLRYAALSFEEEAEATPAPSPSPVETETPPAVAEGAYILVPAGTTAAQLRELFQPEAVVLLDSAGQTFTQGRLATGMTANDRTVVVRGDCDGSGSVTQRDVKAAMKLSLEERQNEGAFFRAADLNEDGIVDGEDILLFQEMIA